MKQQEICEYKCFTFKSWEAATAGVGSEEAVVSVELEANRRASAVDRVDNSSDLSRRL